MVPCRDRCRPRSLRRRDSSAGRRVGPERFAPRTYSLISRSRLTAPSGHLSSNLATISPTSSRTLRGSRRSYEPTARRPRQRRPEETHCPRERWLPAELDPRPWLRWSGSRRGTPHRRSRQLERRSCRSRPRRRRALPEAGTWRRSRSLPELPGSPRSQPQRRSLPASPGIARLARQLGAEIERHDHGSRNGQCSRDQEDEGRTGLRPLVALTTAKKEDDRDAD